MKKSTRHHYIPQFYAKGFTDKEGLFYVYDKKKDEIIKNKRSPKSLFYENDRNTTYTIEGESSDLEDLLYSDLDNQCAEAINNFRFLPNTLELHSEENVAFTKFFALTLVWRVPANDSTFNDFYSKIDITLNDTDGNLVFDPELVGKIKDDESYKKMIRFIAPVQIIMEIIKEHQKDQAHSVLIDLVAPFFLVSDNPVVFKHTPTNTTELVKGEFLMPISCNRMYSTEPGSSLTFNSETAIAFNIIQILQAKHYVCSPDLSVLKQFINLYKLATLNLEIFRKYKRLLFNYKPDEGID